MLYIAIEFSELKRLSWLSLYDLLATVYQEWKTQTFPKHSRYRAIANSPGSFFRLWVISSVSGDLGSVYQTPCVVFTGHPSLRCGDSVHFMEAWGGSSKNAVIFTGERFIPHFLCEISIAEDICVVEIIVLYSWEWNVGGYYLCTFCSRARF